MDQQIIGYLIAIIILLVALGFSYRFCQPHPKAIIKTNKEIEFLEDDEVDKSSNNVVMAQPSTYHTEVGITVAGFTGHMTEGVVVLKE